MAILSILLLAPAAYFLMPASKGGHKEGRLLLSVVLVMASLVCSALS